MSDNNNKPQQQPKGSKKKGFVRRTWKAVKRLFVHGKKTKVEPIVPPLLPDDHPSDPEIVPCTSHLEHEPGGEHAASEPLLITDLSNPEQTEDDDLSVSEESSDIYPGQIPEYLDLMELSPISHEVNWALEEAQRDAGVKNQNETPIPHQSPIASDITSLTSSSSEEESIESSEAENYNGFNTYDSREDSDAPRQYSVAPSGSIALPPDTVKNIPEEKHTKVKKKKKGICGFFRRAWKTVKRPFARFRKTKVKLIVPPLQPDMSDTDSIPDHSRFYPTEGNIKSYYDFHCELGSGSFGTVWQATRRSDGQTVAVKLMLRKHNKSYVFIPGYPMPLVTDVGLMLMMKTPPISSSVIQIFEWFESPRSIKIVMECPPFSFSLRDCIVLHSKLTESTARVIIRQAIQALQDCIDHGVFHCDVHSSNILINEYTLDIKLIDFGCGLLLKTAGYKSSKYNGALKCTPPEVKTQPVFHAVQTNVWQLGILLFEMLIGYCPMDITKEDLSLDSEITKECQDVLRQFLNPDPTKRPTLKQILQHKWFSTVRTSEAEGFVKCFLSRESSDDSPLV